MFGHRMIRRIPGLPSLLDEKIGIATEVEPKGDDWYWSTYFTFNGHRSVICYLEQSWKTPSPYEVRGRCRDQATAWERAREVADDARSRWAQAQIEVSQNHREHFRLG